MDQLSAVAPSLTQLVNFKSIPTTAIVSSNHLETRRVAPAEGEDGAEAEGTDEAGAEFNSPVEGVFTHTHRHLVAVHLKYMHIHVLIRTLAPINFYAYILKWCLSTGAGTGS